MSSEGVLLRNLLIETKDGEWGKDAPFTDSVEMSVIRGTDFETVTRLGLDGIPVRYIAGKAAARKTLMPNDILIETAGGSKGKPTGKTTFLRGELFKRSPLPLTCASFARFMRIDPDQAEPEFIYWYLQSMYQSREIENYQVQHTGIARFQFTKFADSVAVRLPSRDQQKHTCEVLGSINDRITLLRETNATLEAIAQALFKSWFVDFDPVRAKMEGRAPEDMDEATAALFPDSFEETELGVVPRGWRVRPIGELVDTLGGATPDTKNEAFWTPATHHWTSPKDLSGLNTPVLLGTERRISPAGLAKIGSGLLPVGTLLMSSRAPIGYLAVTQIPLAINQGYIAMPPGGVLPPLFMLFWCRHNMDNIKGRANGSTFMEISKKAFRPIPAVEPPSTVVKAFVDVADALLLRLVENEKQAQNLATLRDTLLPRLISGQLRLPEAQAELEAA